MLFKKIQNQHLPTPQREATSEKPSNVTVSTGSPEHHLLTFEHTQWHFQTIRRHQRNQFGHESIFQVAGNAKNLVPLQFSLLIRSGIWHLRWQKIVLKATSLSPPCQLPWPWHSSVHTGHSCLISATPGCTCESDQPNHTNRWHRPRSQLRTAITLNHV